MSDSARTVANDRDPTVEFLLARARQLDPASQETSVRRFWSEMEEAQHALESLGPVDDPLPVAFDPVWDEGATT
jgi:hypothetical protein